MHKPYSVVLYLSDEDVAKLHQGGGYLEPLTEMTEDKVAELVSEEAADIVQIWLETWAPDDDTSTTEN